MSMIPASSSSSGLFKGGSIFGGISDIGAAVSDLFSSMGDTEEAKSYEEAAKLSFEEAKYTELMTGVQQVQETRQITQALGSEVAGYAGSGMAMSGTALNVLQSSAQQGALAKQVSEFKGQQEAYAYTEQGKAYEDMAAAAKMAASGGIFGSIVQGVAAIANFASLL